MNGSACEQESDGCALCQFDGSGPADTARCASDDGDPASMDDGVYFAVDGLGDLEASV